MARSSSPPAASGGGTGKRLVAMAVTAAPVVLRVLRELDTPERRQQLKDWATAADMKVRTLTLEGRVDARIALLSTELDTNRLADQSGSVVAWRERLARIERKRALLRGPFDARARRRHLKEMSSQLEELWAEIFNGD